jgi:hypothetical protein
VGHRPQPGAAGCRATRKRPAEHNSAAHLDDAHVVPVAAALASTTVTSASFAQTASLPATDAAAETTTVTFADRSH